MSKDMGEEPQYWEQTHVICCWVHAIVDEDGAPVCVRHCFNVRKTGVIEKDTPVIMQIMAII